jgi:hypothetical protein
MRTVKLLELDDCVKPTDWCRPLSLQTMSGYSDYYSFESAYSGLPENNVKWIRVEDIFGPCWFNKPAKELQTHQKYEFVRGDIPIAHRLHGHKSLAAFLTKNKKQ